MIAYELLKGRALVITQEVFPKRKDAPILYLIVVGGKVVMLLISIYYTFTVPN